MSDFGSASIDIDSEMEEPHGVTSARCILLVPLTTWRDAKCSTGDLCVIAFGVREIGRCKSLDLVGPDAAGLCVTLAQRQPPLVDRIDHVECICGVVAFASSTRILLCTSSP